MHFTLQGRLLVGMGRLLRLYDVGKKKMLRKCENKVVLSMLLCLSIYHLTSDSICCLPAHPHPDSGHSQYGEQGVCQRCAGRRALCALQGCREPADHIC